jgi:glycerol-3-phosphate O-acyltransferase/dihydroxyacetone phosphate acyltransferase
MLYAVLRVVARIALRLYYRQVETAGLDRIPRTGPVVLVVNHPNALVDALVVCTLVPRRVYLTAKATLFVNPVVSHLFRSAGVIPLRRAKDERAAGTVDPNRNADAFRAVHDTLRRGRALMIFPEGISHDEPSLAPLKTGAARMALDARDTNGVRGLTIVPLGLVFSRKDAPRSRVFAEVGEPIALDTWQPTSPERAISELTDEITRRLLAVTLNFPSLDEAAQAAKLSRLLAPLLEPEASDLSQGGPTLATETAIRRRVEQLRVALVAAPTHVRDRAFAFVDALDAFGRETRALGFDPGEVHINRRLGSGAWFVVRELTLLVVAGLVSLWGQVNHWLPFAVTSLIARRPVSSATDPAMRAILAGAAFVLVAYAIQGAMVATAIGGTAATLYLISLPTAAEIDFRFRERLRRAIRRARAFLLFRSDPQVHEALARQAARLRAEAGAIDALLGGGVVPNLRSDLGISVPGA